MASGQYQTDDEEMKEHHYVAIVLNDGQHMLMHQNSACLSLPKFKSTCSYGFSLEYLAELRLQFDIDGALHVVEAEDFDEYGRSHGHAVSLVIVQVTDKNMSPSKQLVSCYLNDVLAMERACVHSAVLLYLRHFTARSESEGIGAHSAPWCILGYYSKMLASVDRALGNSKGSSYDRVGPLEQIHFSHLSVVYRILTTNGCLYFKVVREDSNELVQTQAITRIFPDRTSQLIASCPDINGIIMADVGPNMFDVCFSPMLSAPAVGYEDETKVAGLILQQWASFQQRSLSHIGELIAVGVPVYDAPWIRQGVEDVLIFVQKHNVLSPEKMKIWQTCKPYIEDTLKLWDELPLPNKLLVHGDLNVTNITQPGGPGSAFVFLDWDDVFIGHPFLDLMDDTYNPLFRHDSGYLECWAEYCDKQTIIRLASWTKPVQHVVSAIVEMQDTSVPMKTRTELIEMYLEDFCEAVQHLKQL